MFAKWLFWWNVMLSITNSPRYGSPGEQAFGHPPDWEMRALLPQPFPAVQSGILAGVRLNVLSCTDTFLVFQRQSSIYGVVASAVVPHVVIVATLGFTSVQTWSPPAPAQ